MIKKYFAFIWFWLANIFAINCNGKKGEPLLALGKKLFYDNRLSFNETKSCASCHDPKFAFTDSYKKSIGAEGEMHKRNSKPLFNLDDNYYLTSADSTLHTVVQQMNNPMLNTSPRELGMKGIEQTIIDKLLLDQYYRNAFNNTFPNQKIELHHLQKAIAAYILSIKSYNTKYDAFVAGNKSVFTTQEKDGYNLFFSKKTNCSSCHGGKDFDTPNKEVNNTYFFNTGIYNTNESYNYPNADLGLYELTKNQNDIGKFRIPTLRNLVFTSPYYHDGSEIKLLEIIKNYNTGGRIIADGVNKGNGSIHPQKSILIKPLQLTENEQRNLLLFLYTLTDSTIVKQ